MRAVVQDSSRGFFVREIIEAMDFLEVDRFQSSGYSVLNYSWKEACLERCDFQQVQAIQE